MSAFLTRSSSNSWAIRKAIAGSIFFFAAIVCLSSEAAPAKTKETLVKNPCTSSENWIFGEPFTETLSSFARNEFIQLLNEKRHPFRAFAEARFLKETIRDKAATTLIDYWLARSLFSAHLYFFAGPRFNKLLQSPPTPETIQVQMAAMGCLEQIHASYSTFTLSDEAFENLPAFYNSGLVHINNMPILWEATSRLLLKKLREKAPEKTILSLLELLKGSGPFEDYAFSIWSIHQDRAAESIPTLAKLVTTEILPPALQRKRNELRMLLARALYEKGDFAQAVKYLDGVDKQSNEIVHALWHISSAQLNAGYYAKSIGTAMNLKSGVFRRTFAPESLTIIAMSLNELCQYPESLRVLNDLKREYRTSFAWLREHLGNGAKSKEALYPLSIAYLKGSDSQVPTRIASEWLRSPIFISRQQTINYSFESVRGIPALIDQIGEAEMAAANEQFEQEREYNDALEQLKTGLDEDEQAERPKRATSKELAAAQQAIRDIEGHQKHMIKAEAPWKNLLGKYEPIAQAERTALTVEIEHELKLLNQRMFQELARSLENGELIEAEIWNGASQDIVWQNAHPEYGKVVQSGQLETDRGPAGGAFEAVQWSSNDLGGTEETWEDELGSVQSGMQDNCTNKLKYKLLKQRRK